MSEPRVGSSFFFSFFGLLFIDSFLPICKTIKCSESLKPRPKTSCCNHHYVTSEGVSKRSRPSVNRYRFTINSLLSMAVDCVWTQLKLLGDYGQQICKISQREHQIQPCLYVRTPVKHALWIPVFLFSHVVLRY